MNFYAVSQLGELMVACAIAHTRVYFGRHNGGVQTGKSSVLTELLGSGHHGSLCRRAVCDSRLFPVEAQTGFQE